MDLVCPPHEEWPRELTDDYQRIRPLGKGAFGIVWLAQAKKLNRQPEGEETDTGAQISIDARNADHPPYVAIKEIDASTEENKEYAEHEIRILSELSHPNVVRCLRSLSTPRSQIVVLTLADGPDLSEIISTGGALGVKLARLAARHLISAVAYLHGRGVIHRDIKPDNCILIRSSNGASIRDPSNKNEWMAMDTFWDDDVDFSEWRVVLVDFGFARALGPAAVGITANEKVKSVRDLSEGYASQEMHENSDRAGEHKSTKRTGRRMASVQGIQFRAMSALGTRGFTAPEIMKVRSKSEGDGARSSHVSDYGFTADAFSVGATIRVLLTGVPADQNEMQFIRSQNNAFRAVTSTILSCVKQQGRKKRYRFLDEAPKAARELVKKFTSPSCKDRLTVPLAREEPWIKGGMDAEDPVITLPVGDISVGYDDPIQCLDCATKRSH